MTNNQDKKCSECGYDPESAGGHLDTCHQALIPEEVMTRKLEENREVLQSLADHDSGKKTISTEAIENIMERHPVPEEVDPFLKWRSAYKDTPIPVEGIKEKMHTVLMAGFLNKSSDNALEAGIHANQLIESLLLSQRQALVEKIKKRKEDCQKETGSFKYDDIYDDIIKMI